ncbi:MAG: TlpA family protein disulfide reductase [Clostridiaceae bacterium]|nr:TlpA family protein disulfide reductase [Clostridiaceae bacterium]
MGQGSGRAKIITVLLITAGIIAAAVGIFFAHNYYQEYLDKERLARGQPDNKNGGLEDKGTGEIPEGDVIVPDKGSQSEDPVDVGPDQEVQQVEEGIQRLQRAPDFELMDIEGNKVKLSDYRGKVVFLNFWATWCGPCRLEMPHFESAHQTFKESQEAVILAVNIQEGKEEVKDFLQDNGFTFPVLLDTSGKVAVVYRIHSIPTTYILDKDGIIQDVVIGPMEEANLLRYVEALSSE